jgi:hypothetical protein
MMEASFTSPRVSPTTIANAKNAGSSLNRHAADDGRHAEQRLVDAAHLEPRIGEQHFQIGLGDIAEELQDGELPAPGGVGVVAPEAEVETDTVEGRHVDLALLEAPPRLDRGASQRLAPDEDEALLEGVEVDAHVDRQQTSLLQRVLELLLAQAPVVRLLEDLREGVQQPDRLRRSNGVRGVGAVLDGIGGLQRLELVVELEVEQADDRAGEGGERRPVFRRGVLQQGRQDLAA